ncbi:MAG: glycosyltransferase family 2 protein [Candidatus Aenigmarchaeota archaeon]|nr:glycosyltransferase family 2 protein [Candidatus Aenigmarchaeota archaeon]MBU5688826.1 glycosyltransferase family 2 protein [Candidatus Aenigmarchaeota archaeon]
MLYYTILVILFSLLLILNLSWIFIFFFAKRRKYSQNFDPPVSVLLPAHNEEEVIEDTIKSILSSDYKNDIEIVVINDGSTDNTEKIVKKLQKKDKRIKLLKTNHVGKARALNFGAKKAKYDYLIFLDADSVLEKNTIKEIIRPLQDPKIAASSGSVRVKITKNPLTWFQDFEYILSSGWRYLCSLINAVSVLPGFFATKKKIFLEIGGFEADTLTEDFDITLRFKKHGYEVSVNPDAVMYTTVPNKLRTLAKQRIRWGRGSLQVIKKHKDMLFSKKHKFLGYYILPTHLFWYIFSLLYLPSVLYWMIGDYYKYFYSTGNSLSKDALLFFFKWICSYGMFDLMYKVFSGIYQLHLLLLITIINYLATITYNILLFSRMKKLRVIHLLAYLFIFPYYLFIILVQFITVIYESINFLMKKPSENKWAK